MFNGGEPVGVLVWLVHGKPVTSVSAIEGANSSLLYVSNEAFIKMHVDSLLFSGNIVKLYRYAPRVYPVYYKSKTLRYDNTSLEDALRFKVEDFTMYKLENGEFRRIKEGKYLTDLWKDSFLLGGVTDFITVYPDGNVHKEALLLESLEDRFLSGNMARCLYGDSVIAFHLFEYRKFVVSEEYRLLAGRNRITRADCGIKEVVTEGTNLGAVVLKDFVANNGVCRTMDDIDFVDISRLSNDIKVLDLSACEHLRGVRINLFKIDGFSLLYPKSENYRDGEFKLTRCNLVNIQGEIRATDVVVYDSEFSSEEVSIQMFPRVGQGITVPLCKFDGATGIKRLTINSVEESDYDYSVCVELINTSVEELSVDFSQGNCRLTPYIKECYSLRKVFIHCEGTVPLSYIWHFLSHNSNNKLEIRVVCGILEIQNSDLAKLRHNNSRQKMLAGAKCIVEASRLIWKGYAVGSPRNRGVDLGFNYLPESVQGIIVRRER